MLFCFTLGDGTNKQSIIGHRDAYANVFPWSNFIVVALWMYRKQFNLINKEQADIVKLISIYGDHVASVSIIGKHLCNIDDALLMYQIMSESIPTGIYLQSSLQ